MSQSTSELPEAHGLVALIPRGRNGRRLGLSIGFLFAEDPIRRFGQVPGHCPDGLRVALALGDALVESTDVAVRLASAHEADRVRGFDERPLEVAVDVRAEPTEARSEEHTSELQSLAYLVCRLLLEKKKKIRCT